MKNRLITLFLIVIAITCGVPSYAQSTMGSVYIGVNIHGANSVVSYVRNSDGTLTFQGLYSTGGRASTGITGLSGGGTTTPITTSYGQGAIGIDDKRRFLFVVNPASGTISTFSIAASGLTLIGQTPSGGSNPISITTRGKYLYVLHRAGNQSLNGFEIQDSGNLTPIAGSRQSVLYSFFDSAVTTVANTIGLDPASQYIVVGEDFSFGWPNQGQLLGGQVLVFPVDSNGVPQPTITALGFGGWYSTFPAFAFGLDQTYLSIGAGLLHWFSIAPTGPINALVNTDGFRICVAPNRLSGFFSSRDNGATVTGFTATPSGQGNLQTTTTTQLPTGSYPTDLGFSSDGKYLYALGAGSKTIYALSVGSNQSLTSIGSFSQGLSDTMVLFAMLAR
jgi:DNA-binding beta-propeller fold protein YncE